MQHHVKSLAGHKSRYQSFYLKKLQTQSSISSTLEHDITQTSQIMQKEIQKIQQDLFKRNSMYSKTLRRKNQLEEEQQKSRQSLKSRIQQKMRKSHQNMLHYRQKSNSSLSNRLKAQNKKIEQIKRLQKTIYDEKYQRAKQMSTKTQKFFLDMEQRKKNKSREISLNTSYLISNRTKSPLFAPIKKFKHKETSHEKSHNNLSLNPQHTRSGISVLKTPRQSILEKQKKKIDLQKSKENSFLRDYMKKMQLIEQSRKKVKLERKVPQSTVPKLINREFNEESLDERKRFSKSFMQQAVSNKNSFSDLYQRKLQEKKERKSFFLSQSIAQGDSILKDQFKQSSKFKLNKLIRQTQNELARKQNFKYMERYLNKRL